MDHLLTAAQAAPGDRLTLERIRRVNDHLTPLGVLVVAPGLMFAPLSAGPRALAMALFLLSLAVNLGSIKFLRRDVDRYGKARVAGNYVASAGLVCLLYRAWPTVWVLLLLMSLGPATYQSRRDTLKSSAAVAALLCAAQFFYGEPTLAAWMEAGVKAAVIVLSAMFVNGVAEAPAPAAPPASPL